MATGPVFGVPGIFQSLADGKLSKGGGRAVPGDRPLLFFFVDQKDIQKSFIVDFLNQL